MEEDRCSLRVYLEVAEGVHFETLCVRHGSSWGPGKEVRPKKWTAKEGFLEASSLWQNWGQTARGKYSGLGLVWFKQAVRGHFKLAPGLLVLGAVCWQLSPSEASVMELGSSSWVWPFPESSALEPLTLAREDRLAEDESPSPGCSLGSFPFFTSARCLHGQGTQSLSTLEKPRSLLRRGPRAGSNAGGGETSAAP